MWLRDQAICHGNLGVALKAGWVTLHTAALRGNAAGVRSAYADDPDSLMIRLERYRVLVSDLPRRTSQKDDDIGRNWARFGLKVGNTLCGMLPMDLAAIPLQRSLMGGLLAVTFDQIQRAAPSVEFSIATPFDALRSAYAVLKKSRSAKAVRAADLFCLMWIGIATRAIIKMHHCELCFRWAIPGHALCYEHSQSKEAHGSSREKSFRYRQGAKIAVGYRYPIRPMPAHVLISIKRLPLTIARVLWHTPLPDEQRTVLTIKRTLMSHPSVFSLIGKDAVSLKPLQLYKRLEERLDPLETNPAAWCWKIRQLVRWEREKIKGCPGHRGHGRGARIKMIEAVNLRRAGFMKSEIARALNLSPSAISNWVRRGKAFGLG